MQRIVKVWPLRPGLQGCDALGKPQILVPGYAGWMTDMEEARAAQDAGDVQIMAGLRPKDLKDPRTAAIQAESPPEKKLRTTKKRAYRRRDLRAESPANDE